MKKLILILLLVSAPSIAGTAFKTGEALTGMTKQCFYNYLGSTYTITIKSYQLCPFTINI